MDLTFPETYDGYELVDQFDASVTHSAEYIHSDMERLFTAKVVIGPGNYSAVVNSLSGSAHIGDAVCGALSEGSDVQECIMATTTGSFEVISAGTTMTLEELAVIAQGFYALP